jgi:DNA-binding protein H-NS
VSKVAAKYRDPATGQTWTGRGKAPKWIEGQDRTPFVIA